MKATLYILLTSILLLSCDDTTVRFKTPQPEGVNPIGTFARKANGEYINCSTPDDKLIIYKNTVLHQRAFKFSTHRNDLEIDTTADVNRNSNEDLEAYFDNNGFSIEFHGDSIKAFAFFTDTLFQTSKDQILKKYKGSYFLNTKKGEAKWDVIRLHLNKKQLHIGEITPSDSLLQFDFVEKTEKESQWSRNKKTEYSITPTKKEFKRLMKLNTFDKSTCYRKIK